MSNHDFHKTPAQEDIIYRLRRMQDLGADLPKIAVMPQSPQDVLTLLAATLTMKEKYATRPLITMSMGKSGGHRALVRFGDDLRYRWSGLRAGADRHR